VKTEETGIAINPQAFIPSKRKAASKALALRDRGKARIRYTTKPTKKDGNPFFAVRCAPELLRAFKAYAKKKKTTPTQLVRAYMSKLTGVKLATEGDDE
jgi:hypothetical protein